jgi:hypothetical protein
MKRRTFLATSTAMSFAGTAVAAPTVNQYIELSFYNLSSGTDQASRLTAFLQNEHLPMTKRLGIGPVGYFGLREAPESARSAAQKRGEALPEVGTRIVTLTAFDSWPALEKKQVAQRADKKWTAAVDALIAEPPTYVRTDSWLLRAFDGLPKIEVPRAADGQKPRIFDLRIAETPNLGAQARKIEMFNLGEIKVFRTCRLHPLLFGETLFGSRRPNFWFMVWYDGPEARDEAWAAFSKDPDWARMQKDPRYKGASTRTTDTYLQPLDFSPIR